MVGGTLNRGRYLLRAVSVVALTFGAVACSPTVNDSIDQNQSFAARAPQAEPVVADQNLTESQKKKKPVSAGANAAQTPETGSSQATADAAKPETDAKTAEVTATKPEDPAKTEAGEQTVADAKLEPAEAPSPKPGEPETADAQAPAETAVASGEATPAPAPKQQKGLFSSLFSNNKANQPKPTEEKPVQVASAEPVKTAFAAGSEPTATAGRQQILENQSPNLTFDSLNAPPATRSAKRNAQPELRTVSANAFADDGEGTGLPGVRKSALFDIKRKSGMNDDSDVDIHEDVEGDIQVASAAGLARLSPNGLLKQRDSVDVACLKPSLIRHIRVLESKFGKKAIITSGYRSPNYNRSVRGAKNSQHMYCAAIDLQIPGVSKWQLANFARSMPGRGGVGTYCHTDSVHIDVGPERDWNWRCRGRRG